MSNRGIAATGETIGLCIGMLQAWMAQMDLTDDDLKAFDDWLKQQDTVLPILDPTAWRQLRPGQIEEARQRVSILRQALALPRRYGGEASDATGL